MPTTKWLSTHRSHTSFVKWKGGNRKIKYIYKKKRKKERNKVALSRHIPSTDDRAVLFHCAQFPQKVKKTNKYLQKTPKRVKTHGCTNTTETREVGLRVKNQDHILKITKYNMPHCTFWFAQRIIINKKYQLLQSWAGRCTGPPQSPLPTR